MELASMLADEPFSDRPAGASPVVAALLRTYNDGLDDECRQDLYPLAALVVGSLRGRAIEEERASRCLAFARQLGRGLPSGRAAIGLAAPEASGSLAALAALATGPAPDVHERTLAFARELAVLRPQPRRRRWPSWLGGRDPGQVVAEMLEAADQPSSRSAAPPLATSLARSAAASSSTSCPSTGGSIGSAPTDW
jgi:hypothetical protein